MELTARSKDLTAEVDGHGVVSHAGSAVVRMIADSTGLTAGLSRALARRGFVPVHARGRVLADMAVLIADGGRVLSDLATLWDHSELFWSVTSDPTLWCTLSEIGTTQRDRIARARAKTRAPAWGLIEVWHGRIPPSRVGDRDLGSTIAVRMDASILISHSDKEQAAGTFTHTYGHHPLMAWCDNTGESLACQPRPGNAGWNTASDHIAVLTEAITQIPSRHRRDLLVTLDGAGATRDLVAHITTLNTALGRWVHYSVGFDCDERACTAIHRVPESAWHAVSDTDGNPRDRDDAGVVKLTGLLHEHPHGDRLTNWPADMRINCRRERPSTDAQLSLFKAADGWRYQLIATTTPTGQPVFLEACHRPYGRVEDAIHNAKNTGIEHLPSKSYEINQTWCAAAMITCDLLCWLRLLCLDGPLATAEPKTRRYRLLHTAIRLVHGRRKRKIKIHATWPVPMSWKPASAPSSRSPHPDQDTPP